MCPVEQEVRIRYAEQTVNMCSVEQIAKMYSVEQEIRMFYVEWWIKICSTEQTVNMFSVQHTVEIDFVKPIMKICFGTTSMCPVTTPLPPPSRQFPVVRCDMLKTRKKVSCMFAHFLVSLLLPASVCTYLRPIATDGSRWTYFVYPMYAKSAFEYVIKLPGRCLSPKSSW
jgi:hypothetical protein